MSMSHLFELNPTEKSPSAAHTPCLRAANTMLPKKEKSVLISGEKILVGNSVSLCVSSESPVHSYLIAENSMARAAVKFHTEGVCKVDSV